MVVATEHHCPALSVANASHHRAHFYSFIHSFCCLSLALALFEWRQFHPHPQQHHQQQQNVWQWAAVEKEDEASISRIISIIYRAGAVSGRKKMRRKRRRKEKNWWSEEQNRQSVNMALCVCVQFVCLSQCKSVSIRPFRAI